MITKIKSFKLRYESCSRGAKCRKNKVIIGLLNKAQQIPIIKKKVGIFADLNIFNSQ